MYKALKPYISRTCDVIRLLCTQNHKVIESQISFEKWRGSQLNKCMSIYYTFILKVPRSFLSFTFSVSSDDRSLTSISFSVSASKSISGNFAIPSRLSCPMSSSKTYLQSHENHVFLFYQINHGIETV
jgi:hypothetical protein